MGNQDQFILAEAVHYNLLRIKGPFHKSEIDGIVQYSFYDILGIFDVYGYIHSGIYL